MRRYHVLGSAILLLASSCLSAETTFRLQTLRVTGSHRFREEELVAALGLRPGNQVDLSALKKAADQLMQTGALATLNYTYTPLSSGIVVEYQVIDAAEFLPCRYENIVWVAMKVKPRKYIPIQATDWSKSSKVISKD
jgi:outer membrane protein assembly factor BamA